MVVLAWILASYHAVVRTGRLGVAAGPVLQGLPLPPRNRWQRSAVAAAAEKWGGEQILLSGVYEDRRGSCALRLSKRRIAQGAQGALLVRLRGRGSKRLARRAVDDLGSAIGAAADRAHGGLRLDSLVDMREATGCSPSGIKACAGFLGAHGSAFGRVAVVGRGMTLTYVRAIVLVTGLKRIRVFGDMDRARNWLLTQGGPSRTANQQALSSWEHTELARHSHSLEAGHVLATAAC